ncbi:FtsX-like permease family protein [Cohnella caldifontis]|uniref:FtsX-like permease family protein n=1 Tax=Cohnella caldifontis TaxID=3027471 RepID=UPI0023ECA6A3|nr:ABC transporter permease [Cohnella sp. YIM B05605]
MTFRSLALSNIRGNRRAYAAFFLSSVFSVLVFYLYAAFLYHPGVTSGYIYAAGQVRQGMRICEILIAIFSFFFVLYSHSAFMKTRKKEFGLFSLFGMTRGQIRKMVLYESAFLALLAIAAGIGLGLLFSKLFFMALAVLLDSETPIPFAVPGKAVALTGAGFFALFMAISLLTMRRTGRTEIVDLLKDAHKPKPEPKHSRWLAILCVLCLGGGYGLAAGMSVYTFLMFMLPVVGLTVIGTYFLFTQGSLAAIRFLQRRKSLYYRRTRMLIVSQMAFKMKDNARVLFSVSILGAVLLTASGTVYSFQKVQRDQLLEHMPYTVGYIEHGDSSAHEVADPDVIRRILKEDGKELTRELELSGLLASRVAFRPDDGGKARQLDGDGAMAVPASGYNAAASRFGQPPVALTEGSAAVILPYREMLPYLDYTGSKMEADVGGRKADLSIADVRAGSVVSPVSSAEYLIVLSDADYAKLSADAAPSQRLTAYGFEWKDWENSLATAEKIEKAMSPAAKEQAQTKRVAYYSETKQSMALTFFIGLFITLLFFVASGSMLYFKLFTELQDDRAQFRALVKIGMTAAEIRRVVMAQVGILFFVPCAVGIAHALFAMYALSNILGQSVFAVSSHVFVAYVLLQAIYFGISCSSYLRSIAGNDSAAAAAA